MKILIDTHILIYVLDRKQSLSLKQIDALSDTDNKIYVSHFSLLEIVIKQALGKLPEIKATVIEIEKSAIEKNIEIVPIGIENLAAYPNVPLFENHRDPFDRFIIATAKTKG